MEKGDRSFKVIGLKKPAQGSLATKCYEGRYISKTPSGAAKKAINAHCSAKHITNQCTLNIKIQETTQGSNHKEYDYRAKRVVVNKEVMRDGKPLVHKFDVNLKSLKTPIPVRGQKCHVGKPKKTRKRSKKGSKKKSNKA